VHTLDAVTESAGVRLLLVANRTCPCPALPAQVREQVGDRNGHVLVLAPALNSRLRHWVSDVDDAIEAAHTRMSGIIHELSGYGIAVTGEVGDADPLQAIADALVTMWSPRTTRRSPRQRDELDGRAGLSRRFLNDDCRRANLRPPAEWSSLSDDHWLRATAPGLQGRHRAARVARVARVARGRVGCHDGVLWARARIASGPPLCANGAVPREAAGPRDPGSRIVLADLRSKPS
jgi:hypothetical protein